MNKQLILILLGGLVTAPVLAASDDATQARLDRLERRVSHITELMLEVEALKQENRRLQGQIEEQQHMLEGIKRKQRDLYLDIDQRLGQMQTAAPAVPARPVPGPTPGVTVKTPESTPLSPSSVDPAKEEAAYRAAYALLSPERRQYQDAIIAFRDFLAKYPNGKMADNAQYWLAEASYVTQDNKSALTEFRKLLELYPQSPKVPGALLKIGYILHADGEVDAAKENLQRILAEYPTSSAADMARTRLDRMKRESS